MTTDQLLNAYREYAAKDTQADAEFDLLNFPDLPERPVMTVEAKAGEIISRRGSLAAALIEAEYGIEDPDCPEALKEAYQLVIGLRSTKPRHYRIRPLPTPGTVDTFGIPVTTNGVYVTQHGAYLGQVDILRENGQLRWKSVMPHIAKDAIDYVPAPANWRDLIIEELPGIIE